MSAFENFDLEVETFTLVDLCGCLGGVCLLSNVHHSSKGRP